MSSTALLSVLGRLSRRFYSNIDVELKAHQSYLSLFTMLIESLHVNVHSNYNGLDLYQLEKLYEWSLAYEITIKNKKKRGRWVVHTGTTKILFMFFKEWTCIYQVCELGKGNVLLMYNVFATFVNVEDRPPVSPSIVHWWNRIRSGRTIC